MKVFSGILIVVTALLSFKHGWAGVTNNVPATQAEMLSSFGISKPVFLVISVLILAVGVMVLFPQTFFVANLINAMLILSIMALALKAGNIKMALIEVPFLMLPLVLIWLGHPFKK
jgi:hypothetical protein